MGLLTWIGAGVAAWLVSRAIPRGRPSGWLWELLIALGAAVLAGVLATALDFGGWRETDLRAAAFSLLIAGSLIAVARLRRIGRRNGNPVL